MKTSDALTEIRSLIATQDRWLRFSYAQDEDGAECEPIDPLACSFCLAGARVWAKENIPGVGDTHKEQIFHIQEAIAEYTPVLVAGIISSVAFNDHDDTTHEDVLAVLDRAIENARLLEST